MFRRTLTSICKTLANSLEVNLIGRDYIHPNNLTPHEVKALLWTAFDLKTLHKNRCLNIEAISGTRVTLLLDRPSLQTQLLLNNVSKYLKTTFHVIVDDGWKQDLDSVESGRFLSLGSDITFCRVCEQSKIEDLANGTCTSVVNIRSYEFDLIQTLAELMTVQSYFGYLRHLTVALIDLPHSSMNTYLELLPRLCMNIKYCTAENPISATDLTHIYKYTQHFNTELHECCNVSEAIHRSDVIITSRHNSSDLMVTPENVKEAAVKWALIHKIPRSHCDVSCQLVNKENYLLWESVENCQWIYAAMIVRFLIGYKPKIELPNFEENKECTFVKV